jgi:thiol-disulfide isomerase/thioredoxin
MSNLKHILLLTMLLLISACIVIDTPFTKLPPGKWVGVLKLDKEISGAPMVKPRDVSPIISFSPVNSGELPFEFEVVYTDKDNFEVWLINANDTFRTSDIIYGTDRSKAKDTFEIHFPMYNTLLKGYYEEDVMEGEWIVGDRENYRIPFVAHFGRSYKFTELKKSPAEDISGLWRVEMGVDKEKSTTLLANFSQLGNSITGTFSGTGGDYRFLSGTVQGNKLYLSQFDGATAYLIEAKIEQDGSLTGLFRSGKHYDAIWTATRTSDETINMHQHSSENIGKVVNFTYVDENGLAFSLNSPERDGKPKVLQIFGSWCHNCYDEAKLFAELIKKNQLNVEFIGLAVERSKEASSALNRIKSFRKATGVTYPLLLVSTTTDKEKVLESMPFLQDISVYPSTIYLDAENRIVSIKSGFFGPASHLHEKWKSAFIDELRRIQPNLSEIKF